MKRIYTALFFFLLSPFIAEAQKIVVQNAPMAVDEIPGNWYRGFQDGAGTDCSGTKIHMYS